MEIIKLHENHTTKNKFGGYVDPNHKIKVPIEYKAYFQDIENQVDSQIKLTLVNHQKQKFLNITNLMEKQSFVKQAVYTKSPIDRIKTELNGIIIHFRVMKSPFIINIKMLHLKRNSINYQQSYQQSQFTQTYYSHQLQMLIRRIPFKKNNSFQIKPQNWNFLPNMTQIEEGLDIVSIHKLASLFQVGIQYRYICDDLDMICYEDCMQFGLERPQKIEYKDRNFDKIEFEYRLKICTRLLHKLNLTYGYFELQNIVINKKKMVLDHFELVGFRGQNKDNFQYGITNINQKYGIMQDFNNLKQLIQNLKNIQPQKDQKSQQLLYPKNTQYLQFYYNLITFIQLFKNHSPKAFQIYQIINNHPFNLQLQCQFNIRTQSISQSLISILKSNAISPKISYLKQIIIRQYNQQNQKHSSHNQQNLNQRKILYMYNKFINKCQCQIYDFFKGIYLIDRMLQCDFIFKKKAENILKILFHSVKNQQQQKILIQTKLIVKYIHQQDNQFSQKLKLIDLSVESRLFQFLKLLYKIKQYETIIKIFNNQKNKNNSMCLLFYTELAYFQIGNTSKCQQLLNYQCLNKQKSYRNYRLIMSYISKYNLQHFFNKQDERQIKRQLKTKLKQSLIMLKKQIHFPQSLIKIRISIRTVKSLFPKDNQFFTDIFQQYKCIKYMTYNVIQYLIELAEYSYLIFNNIQFFQKQINNLQKKLIDLQGQSSYKICKVYLNFRDFFKKLFKKSKKKEDIIKSDYFQQKGQKILKQLYYWHLYQIGCSQYLSCLDLYQQKKYRTIIQISNKLLFKFQNQYIESSIIHIYFLILVLQCYKNSKQNQLMQKYLEKSALLITLCSYNCKQLIACSNIIISSFIYLKLYDRCFQILTFYNQKIKNQQKQNTYWKIYLLQYKSQIYTIQKQYQKAILCEKQIIQKVGLNINNQSNIIKRAYGRLGLIYYFLNNLEKAVFCFENSRIKKIHSCELEQSIQKLNLYYKYLSKCYYQLKQYQRSAYIGLRIVKEHTLDNIFFDMICSNLIQMKKKNMVKKLIFDHIKKLREKKYEIKQKGLKEQCYCYLNLCNMYVSQKRYLQLYLSLKHAQNLKLEIKKNIKKSLYNRLRDRDKKLLKQYYQIFNNPLNYVQNMMVKHKQYNKQKNISVSIFLFLKLLKNIKRKKLFLLLQNEKEHMNAEHLLIRYLNYNK